MILAQLCVASLLALLSNARLMPMDYFSKASFARNLDFNNFKNSAPSDDPFLGLKYKAGFIDVGMKGGRMFYWLIPKTTAATKNQDSPWIIWLTGGPGCSSELAMFTENGPLTVQHDGSVVKNKYSWSNVADVVYIDQPLGTGFSITGNVCNYATDEHGIAIYMKEFLEKFLFANSEFKNKPFYITGESFAGHYIPSIGHYLNKYPVDGLNFKGVAIGNGWVDPIYQYPAYATYAYENHLIGKMGYEIASKGLAECVDLIKKKQTVLAAIQCNTLFSSMVGKKNQYDIRLNCEIPPMCYNDTALTNFLNQPNVQHKIGVHQTWTECSKGVYMFLLNDFDTQTRTKVEQMLKSGIKVLVYNGDKDFICNWKGGESWVNALEWNKKTEFTNQEYKTWSVQQKPAGLYRNAGLLTFIKIFDAGHMVPMDQPEVSLQMLKDFLFDDEKIENEDFAVKTE